MTNKQMNRVAWTTISIGISLQFGGFLDALIVREPHWMDFYLLSIPMLLTGYYLGLQGKGYRPYRMPAFYGMMPAMIVPYIGSVAVARKLFFTPRQGAAPDRKRWQVSLWAIALFIAIIIALASLSLPGFIANKKKETGALHNSIIVAGRLQEFICLSEVRRPSS